MAVIAVFGFRTAAFFTAVMPPNSSLAAISAPAAASARDAPHPAAASRRAASSVHRSAGSARPNRLNTLSFLMMTAGAGNCATAAVPRSSESPRMARGSSGSHRRSAAILGFR